MPSHYEPPLHSVCRKIRQFKVIIIDDMELPLVWVWHHRVKAWYLLQVDIASSQDVCTYLPSFVRTGPWSS